MAVAEHIIEDAVLGDILERTDLTDFGTGDGGGAASSSGEPAPVIPPDYVGYETTTVLESTAEQLDDIAAGGAAAEARAQAEEARLEMDSSSDEDDALRALRRCR